jgi:hypothetical protein
MTDPRIEEQVTALMAKADEYAVAATLSKSDSWPGGERRIAIESAIRAALVAERERANGQKLWLWRNGDHYLAFEHLYPCFTPGGDPMTLGEPVGYALFRKSYDRALRERP